MRSYWQRSPISNCRHLGSKLNQIRNPLGHIDARISSGSYEVSRAWAQAMLPNAISPLCFDTFE